MAGGQSEDRGARAGFPRRKSACRRDLLDRGQPGRNCHRKRKATVAHVESPPDDPEITVSYGHVPAVQNLNVELRCGCCVGLLGPNGAGKSTLLKAIAGLVTLQSGKIELHGHEPRQARSIAYLPQRGVIDWDFPITVRGWWQWGDSLRSEDGGVSQERHGYRR